MPKQSVSNDSTKNIHEGHRDRLKDRFVNHGLRSFAQHQVLELLLFYCYDRRRDTNEVAHMLINEFGNLHNLFNAESNEIQTRGSVTKHVAVLLSMVPGLLQQYMHSQWSGKIYIDSPRAAGKYCSTLLFGEQRECMYVLCMNKQRRLLYSELISRGTTDQVMIYPRVAVEAVFKHNANVVILTHNHPSGVAKPSRSDVELTNNLINLFEQVGITIDDHIIVAADSYCSLYELGIIPKWNNILRGI